MNRRQNVINRQTFTYPAFSRKKLGGFTLIEVLIVIAISAMLSTIVITYSSISRNEVSVTVEAAKISQAIFQAKTLALTEYANSQHACGYGVSFNYGAGTYSIFEYDPLDAPPCPDSTAIKSISPDEMVQYNNITWNIPISKGVVFLTKTDSAALVLFYPPDPKVFISLDGTTFMDANNSSANIYLAANGNTAFTEVISVNSAGQITL